MTNEELKSMAVNIERIATKVETCLRGDATRDAVVALSMILGETVESVDALETVLGCIKTRFEEMKQIRAKK